MSSSLQQEDLSHLPQDIQDRILMLERMRQDFVANVSHELRTPLTVLKGYLETLVDNPDLPESLHHIHSQMLDYSQRMETIINDLLLLASIEHDAHHKETMHKVNMPAIIQQVIKDAVNISGQQQHQFQLNIDEGLMIDGYENELKGLVSNLIINAVKYTPAHGIITITWQQDVDQALFSVKDTGLGIEAKHIPRLTERFYRVDKARSRKSGGTGLGLAIVKHILMHYDTDLIIHSEVGEGSEFLCHFPLSQ